MFRCETDDNYVLHTIIQCLAIDNSQQCYSFAYKLKLFAFVEFKDSRKEIRHIIYI